MRPLVLVDATPIRTGSGLRGIGRYAYDLLQGLEALRPEWQDELDLRAVVNLGVRPRWSVQSDLRSAADELLAARGTAGDGFILKRRAWLGRASLREGAGLLHMTEPLGMPIGPCAPRLVTCHDVIPLVYPEHYLGGGPRGRLELNIRRWKDARRYQSAVRVVAISSRSKQDLVRLVGVPPELIDVVPNGIDLGRFGDGPGAHDDEAVLRRLGVGRKPFALYVGDGDYRKNVRVMFAALAHARRELDLELVWAGWLDRKLRARTLELARGYDVEPALRLLGFVDEQTLPSLYRAAVAHLFVSRLEGFGLTVVEAMACGCPVVVARGSSADEVAGPAGIVVHPDDAVRAGGWLLRLAREPELREAFVTRGLERAPQFGRERMARGYLESYRAALAQREASDGARAP